MKKALQILLLCFFLLVTNSKTSLSVEQKNYTPVAIIEIQKGKTEGEAPLSVNLDGSKSKAPLNLELEYSWEFPDKIIKSKNPKPYIFRTPGKHTVTLKVKNSLGFEDKVSLEFTIFEKKEKQGDLSDKIIINEVFPNPQGKDLGKEWIELYNQSNKDISLQNWKISNSKFSKEIKDTNIKAKDYKILENLNFYLKNKKETITLSDFNGTKISQLKYSQSKEGLSYTKNKTWTSPSKGKKNNIIETWYGKIIKRNNRLTMNNKTISISKDLNIKLLDILIEQEKLLEVKVELLENQYKINELDYLIANKKNKKNKDFLFNGIIICEIILAPLLFCYNKSFRSIAV